MYLRFLLVIPLLVFLSGGIWSQAEIQIINNSPSPDLDIYIEGELVHEAFAFRSATAYLEFPAGDSISFAIAESPSSSVDNAFARFDAELTPDEAFILILGGIPGDDDAPFSFDLFSAEREAPDPVTFPFCAYHGSPDVPELAIMLGTPHFKFDLEYRERTDYFDIWVVGQRRMIIQLFVPERTDPLKSFLVEFEDLGGHTGMVIVSGFKNPADGQAELKLILVRDDGVIIELEELHYAYLQLINNSPSSTIDLWLGDEKILEDFEFRSATPYLDLPPGEIEVGVALSPSESPNDTIANFELDLLIGHYYTAFLHGIVGDPDVPFNLEFRRIQPSDSEYPFIRVGYFHGDPDLPDVNIVKSAPNISESIYEGLSFGEFQNEILFVEEYQIAIRLSEEPLEDLAVFSLPLEDYVGNYVKVFISGFLEGGEPPFGVFAVLDDGTVIMLDLISSVGEVHDLANLGIYPNPARDMVNIGLPEDQRTGANEILVHNVKGQLMSSFDIDSEADEFQLDVSNYEEGYYLVTVITEEGVWTGRILVKR